MADDVSTEELRRSLLHAAADHLNAQINAEENGDDDRAVFHRRHFDQAIEAARDMRAKSCTDGCDVDGGAA